MFVHAKKWPHLFAGNQINIRQKLKKAASVRFHSKSLSTGTDTSTCRCSLLNLFSMAYLEGFPSHLQKFVTNQDLLGFDIKCRHTKILSQYRVPSSKDWQTYRFRL